MSAQSPLRDPVSGQELFFPKRGRSPVKKGDRNPNIYDHLYAQSQKKTPSKSPVLNESSQIKIDRNSDRIVRDLQNQKLREIFVQLDSDNDGWISAMKIAINAIPPKVYDILQPVLQEMEDFNFCLNEKEFMEAVERLLRTVTSQQKAILLDYGKKPTISENN